jgi:uncharacterized surface protein with fasciclin (FAS1) repeats
MLLLATVVFAAACGGSGQTAPGGDEGPGGIPTFTPTPTVTPQVVPSVSASTIVDAAREGDLEGFVSVVAAAGLDAVLEQEIPYTVLAPSQEAFRTLGLEELIKNVSEAKTVMSYSIIPAENLQIAAIEDGQEVPTYLGYPVRFTVKDGAVMVNDANVVKVIEGPTWSIFVIDKVLQPPHYATPEGSPSASEAPAP